MKKNTGDRGAKTAHSKRLKTKEYFVTVSTASDMLYGKRRENIRDFRNFFKIFSLFSVC